MNQVDQFFALITPVAVLTAILSGVAFGWVIHALRPTADVRLITYLVLVMSLLWYGGQMAQLLVVEGTGWSTAGRWTVFVLGFITPMHITLRLLQRKP